MVKRLQCLWRKATISTVFASAYFAAIVAASTSYAEFRVQANPTFPTADKKFSLSAKLYSFPDPGQRLADQSIAISGTDIDLFVLMEDLHTPGSAWVQVLMPGGATFNDLGPLAEGTYRVDAEMWIRGVPGSIYYPPEPSRIASRTVNLIVKPAGFLQGDFNSDGFVNAADYTLWRNSYGEFGEGLAADGTGPVGVPDGFVDKLDYNLWKAHFGDSRGSAVIITEVPEPASALLLTAAGLAPIALLRGRRTRRK